ncbi:MAG: polyprenyl synthetase family protein [Muricauda sp.]|uniref:Putative isoprenoid biosynthesis related protein n=1 Tax=Flagellimonas lutaonensis TaxID=516051 RepID=A0A0D5YSG1_9FLAO|nr:MULTISPECIES: polyprenyl synthetase family protein [Allomuricauda]AKA35200.1 Putative isoprenoid biosynthesis related protein [Allomuricauda lutaonensis]MBC29492.1 polyprenyl synthetase family protein [Allomuricauda sp.]
MHTLDHYRTVFTAYLEAHAKVKKPQNLYRPIAYILGLGGKRLRPVLTLMGCDLFGGDHNHALPAAMAVEVFHNFSLVHDDIMDDAPLRRGQPTVHEKWNINTGILSGDAMLINAYQFLEGYKSPVFNQLLGLFSKTAMEVCEGQQYDIDFETRNDVTVAEYLTMIEYKTAVLIAAALKMGAIVAGAQKKDQDLIYEFGRNLGIAFQLQDDFLDAFGDPKTFGKQVGGDIIENKKTFLYLKALEQSVEADRKTLTGLFAHQAHDPASKIEAVKEIFKKSGAMEATDKEIEEYTQRAFDALDRITAEKADKKVFEDFGRNLMQRTF